MSWNGRLKFRQKLLHPIGKLATCRIVRETHNHIRLIKPRITLLGHV
ncbi:MAG: hypothetical protein QOH96_2038 [Blastocatellia bacterium]|jgi:hypothetical protein|nr:hypothetical protein [Blastocatellia bacterium]